MQTTFYVGTHSFTNESLDIVLNKRLNVTLPPQHVRHNYDEKHVVADITRYRKIKF